MKGRVLAATLAAAIASGGVEAEVRCATNALGAQSCIGVPRNPPRMPQPYPRAGRGLGAVQPPAAAAKSAPKLTPAGRTDVLGNTFLSKDDLPPDRSVRGVAGPRDCARDTLGNLVCR